ncbi:hemolymph lipopolysaccharide-binding protein [Anabrus simplex]|uniref:hemolymph lipopolysaccharide-binding protein n=1 Tax=Anabrus simplex TaxID=316456 RepID=UPI0035A336F4
MELTEFTWTLVVAAVLGCRTIIGQCIPPSATNFSLSVSSLRNHSGHLLLAVDAARKDSIAQVASGNPRQVVVDVDHITEISCDIVITRLSVRSNLSDPAQEMEMDVEPTKTTKDIEETTSASTKVTVTGSRIPPEDYNVVAGRSRYKIYTSSLVWKDARQKCDHEGAHLMVINSQEEAKLVNQLVLKNSKNITGADYVSYVFLGFHWDEKEKRFITVQGDPIEKTGYSKWYPGEPSTTGCGSSLNDQLYELSCSHKLAFICEFEVQ